MGALYLGENVWQTGESVNSRRAPEASPQQYHREMMVLMRTSPYHSLYEICDAKKVYVCYCKGDGDSVHKESCVYILTKTNNICIFYTSLHKFKVQHTFLPCWL